MPQRFEAIKLTNQMSVCSDASTEESTIDDKIQFKYFPFKCIEIENKALLCDEHKNFM